jgi:hypothetical protein
MKALILLSLLALTIAIPVFAVGGERNPGPQRAVTLFGVLTIAFALLLRFAYSHL